MISRPDERPQTNIVKLSNESYIGEMIQLFTMEINQGRGFQFFLISFLPSESSFCLRGQDIMYRYNILEDNKGLKTSYTDTTYWRASLWICRTCHFLIMRFVLVFTQLTITRFVLSCCAYVFRFGVFLAVLWSVNPLAT